MLVMMDVRGKKTQPVSTASPTLARAGCSVHAMGGNGKTDKGVSHARLSTHFLKMPINVLSFDPSFGCSSGSGTFSGAVAGGAVSGDASVDGAAVDEDVNAHMVRPRRASFGTTRRRGMETASRRKYCKCCRCWFPSV